MFPDADLAAAANGLVAGVLAATGQTCMVGSRLILHESVHDELVKLVTDRAATIKLGDPFDPATEMGPVANQPQFETVRGYLETAVAEGATVACGGLAGDGYFVRPTVLTGVGPQSTVVREELFGLAVAPGVPFGGYGASGIGRENGMAALDEYTEIKAVWVELSGNTRDPFVLG